MPRETACYRRCYPRLDWEADEILCPVWGLKAHSCLSFPPLDDPSKLYYRVAINSLARVIMHAVAELRFCGAISSDSRGVFVPAATASLARNVGRRDAAKASRMPVVHVLCDTTGVHRTDSSAAQILLTVLRENNTVPVTRLPFVARREQDPAAGPEGKGAHVRASAFSKRHCSSELSITHKTPAARFSRGVIARDTRTSWWKKNGGACRDITHGVGGSSTAKHRTVITHSRRARYVRVSPSSPPSSSFKPRIPLRIHRPDRPRYVRCARAITLAVP